MSSVQHEWRNFRACKGLATELFFPKTKGIAKHTIAICSSCPVRTECLSYAVANGIEYGIWGGTTERERLPMIRAHQAIYGKPLTGLPD